MDSGSDSNKSQEYPQWALNPSAYQNVANNQVDWAALAQQWITMKEAGIPPMGGGDPSRNISEPHNNRKRLKTDHSKDGGGGNGIEAAALVPPPIWNNMADPPVPPGAADYWDNQDKTSWGWNASALPNNAWIHSAAAPIIHKNIGTNNKPSLLPTPNSYITQQNSIDNTNTIPFNNYNQFNSSDNSMSSSYWDASSAANVAKQIKPHNKRFSKVNVPVRAPLTNQIELPNIPVVPDIPATPILDAAKRKQLPAWIKEGLEKMEKDKLKQMEKEKQKKQKEEIIEKTKNNNKDSIELLKSTMKERQKSKFDSDSENSDDEAVVDSSRNSRAVTPEPIVTPEELMLKIRRTMTDLLLKVTDIQIEQICREELQRSIKKKSKDSLSSSSGRSKMYSSNSSSSSKSSRFSRHDSSSSRSRRSSSPRPD